MVNFRRLITSAAVLIALLVVSTTAAQNPFDIQVFIDTDTLTLYVPSAGNVSLDGFGYQVLIDGETSMYRLSQYPAFGVPLGSLRTPICFQLRRSTSTTPLPNACPRNATLTQELSAADIFWYDMVARVPRVIVLVQGSEVLGYCGSGLNVCEALFIPPTFTPTLPATDTPTFTPTLNATNTPTLTPTRRATRTRTPTRTPSRTPTPTPTRTPRVNAPAGWVIETPFNEVFTYYRPGDWFTADRSPSTFGVILMANSQVLLDAMTQTNAHYVSGDLSIIVSGGAADSYMTSVSQGGVESILEYIITSTENAGIEIFDSGMTEIDGMTAGYMIIRRDDAESAALVVEVAPEFHVILSGSSSPGEIEDATQIMWQIARTVRVN